MTAAVPRRAAAVVVAARDAVGSRFRLHGRTPGEGFDCVGLVAWALGLDAVPTGYALRGGTVERVQALLAATGLARVPVRSPGDVLLCGPGPGQLHLAIWTGGGVVHADAHLRRVVERPGEPPWAVIGYWRG